MTVPPLFHSIDDLHRRVGELRQQTIFFIGGTMKSGTTWLQLVLDHHPDISCRGEGHFIRKLCPMLGAATQGYNDFIAGKNRSVFSETAGYPPLADDQLLYLWSTTAALLLAGQAGERVVRAYGEKTPENVSDFAMLEVLFPQARLIHMVRDGRDGAVSGWFHNQRVDPDWIAGRYASMADYVIDFAESWVTDLRLGEEFAARAPDRYLMLRYEDLGADPAATLARACQFLGVSDDAAIIADCLEQTSFEKLSGRSRGEADNGSFFRKGVAGDWVNHFDDALNQAFLDKAGEELRRYGYI